ncbi:MAG: hypothetical protein J2P13_08135, partial [Acidobacteria bacterium]|nr:hypothetical protein [Acidobacteriota bacterium]
NCGETAMSCEKYREALIDAAATGEATEGALAEHLAECPECRAVDERERALFLSIDGALGGRVNERPRESFLPRIRDRVRHEGESRAGWNPMWAWAGAASALLLLAMAHPWTALEKHPAAGRLNGAGVEVPQTSVREPSNRARLERGSAEISRRREHVRRHPAGRSMAKQSATGEPEVLVPPDEAEAFRQFVARVASGDQMALAVASPAKENATASNAELPVVRSVDIAELQLRPEKWRGWDGGSDPE